ncbi:hypothetical protein AMECASPLE_021777 [Ameca splendens]|uniref:Uncharacterized protein n=1 Tax=Ameca splendens TaxID=208324 RepID=A0ABV0XGN0_9TELE
MFKTVPAIFRNQILKNIFSILFSLQYKEIYLFKLHQKNLSPSFILWFLAFLQHLQIFVRTSQMFNFNSTLNPLSDQAVYTSIPKSGHQMDLTLKVRPHVALTLTSVPLSHWVSASLTILYSTGIESVEVLHLQLQDGGENGPGEDSERS